MIADELPAGAEVSAVVPDMRADLRGVRPRELTNFEFLNERFIYSYEQPSHHVWCYDIGSLRRVFEPAGYDDVAADRPPHVGSRVLEGRSRVALAVRGARDRACARSLRAARRHRSGRPTTPVAVDECS